MVQIALDQSGMQNMPTGIAIPIPVPYLKMGKHLYLLHFLLKLHDYCRLDCN